MNTRTVADRAPYAHVGPTRRARLVLAFGCLLLTSSAAFAQSWPATGLASAASRLCEAAVRTAERRYDLPAGLLFAISLAETGRPDPTGQLHPWPWSVQAENTSYYFDTRAQAVSWVQQARARGVASIDTGCMQVNLFFHPRAFATIDRAFDPPGNADYAARFLVQLHAATNDWVQAIGLYHSTTPALQIPYRQRVQRAMNGLLPTNPPVMPVTVADQLAKAWGATLDPGPPS